MKAEDKPVLCRQVPNHMSALTLPGGTMVSLGCMKDSGHPGRWHKVTIHLIGESIRYSWKAK